MGSAIFVKVAAPLTKFSLEIQCKYLENFGNMAKISLHALLISRKHIERVPRDKI